MCISNPRDRDAGSKPPSLGAARNHLINIIRHFVTLTLQEIPSVLEALCQKQKEDQIYTSYYKSEYRRRETRQMLAREAGLPSLLRGQ